MLSPLVAAEEPRAPGEIVAAQYMEAFFRGHIETAAGFLSSAVLDPFKKAAVTTAQATRGEGQLKFLAVMGYSSIDELREAAPRDVFVRVTKLQRAGTPDFAGKIPG